MSEATNVYGEDIHLTTVDASTIYDTLIGNLEDEVGETLYPGDERRIYAEALVTEFVQLYNKIDDCSRQTMLQYARGEVLDALGARLGVTRLPGTSAHTTLRFSVAAPMDENIIIPKWTKVTPDSKVYFATDSTGVLEAGAYSVEIEASSIGTGESYNGLSAGSLKNLVDKIPYVTKVENITETYGGDDGEPYTEDGDDRFRERIRLAPYKLSTAGPEQAYVYYALTADPSITDVKAVSEIDTIKKTLTVSDNMAYIGGARLKTDTLSVRAHGAGAAAVLGTDYSVDYTDDLLTITTMGALKDASQIDVVIDRTMEGRVKIVPLLEGGAAPSAELKKKILDVVDAADIRPMTDLVTVEAPEMVEYDINLTYWTAPDVETEVVTNMEDSGGAIERFNEWQCESLGRDINPDMLRRFMLSPDWEDNLSGAVRVEVTSPQYREIPDTAVAHFSGHLKVSHIVKSGVI